MGATIINHNPHNFLCQNLESSSLYFINCLLKRCRFFHLFFKFQPKSHDGLRHAKVLFRCLLEKNI